MREWGKLHKTLFLYTSSKIQPENEASFLRYPPKIENGRGLCP